MKENKKTNSKISISNYKRFMFVKVVIDTSLHGYDGRGCHSRLPSRYALTYICLSFGRGNDERECGYDGEMIHIFS
ncbi:MAG: hypothetical protein LBP40_01945 [Campylobacteraceae bacterium]|nr:hypothetical protein [Campylobacteraceae bacterium]